MSIASNEKPSMVEKLWGKQPSHGALLSYASADASVTGSIPDTRAEPDAGRIAALRQATAVYDIAAKKVICPTAPSSRRIRPRLENGRRALCACADAGRAPPHIYELKPRKALFHGVPALRLTPIGGQDKIFGRDGLLAHTYMLGASGNSNGCVSFKDYYAFLNAYRNQGIRRLAVLAKVESRAVAANPRTPRNCFQSLPKLPIKTLLEAPTNQMALAVRTPSIPTTTPPPYSRPRSSCVFKCNIVLARSLFRSVIFVSTRHR